MGKIKYKRGKNRRLRNKINKLSVAGFGKKWEGKQLWYRVETCLEDEELEQENLQIHWIAVREFNKKERLFYRQFMESNGHFLNPGELVETQYLLSYLEDYRSQNNFFEKFNRAFLFPANKKGDKRIKQPVMQINWRTVKATQKFNQAIAAVYQSTIWHEVEKDDSSKKAIAFNRS